MEEILYYIGQGLSVVAVILGFVNYQVKTREHVLYVHIATTVCFTLHYLFIGAYSGMVLNCFGIIRNIVYYFTGKKGNVSRFVALFFSLGMGFLGALSWQNIASVLVVAGLIINSYAMSFQNSDNIRKSILISSPLVLAYDVIVGSFGGAVYEAIVIISSVIGLVRFRKGNK